jgi:amino acid permease
VLNPKLLLYSASTMANNKCNKLAPNLKYYVKNNWGSPFIIIFIVLLLSAGISLSIGLSFAADQLAVCSFFALVLGVMLQFVCYLKYPNADQGEAA